MTTDQLLRKGYVKKIQTQEGVVIEITDNGHKEVLKYSLASLAPVKSKWDGRWRLVFFDVAEFDRKKRDQFRKYLKQLFAGDFGYSQHYKNGPSGLGRE